MPHRDDRLLVYSAGTDSVGTWVAGVCGVELRVGDELLLGGLCDEARVRITGIELYGHRQQVLESGVSGKLWLAPHDLALRVAPRGHLRVAGKARSSPPGTAGQ